MIRPSLEEAHELSRGYSVCPVALEILSDVKTPIEVLRNLRECSDDWYIFESVNGTGNWGRYTFLGFMPDMEVCGEGGRVTVRNGSCETSVCDDPARTVKELLSSHKSPRVPGLPPFTGGFVGYFAYDFAGSLIPGLVLYASGASRDFHLMRMSRVIAFDHFAQKIHIIVNITTDDIERSYARGVEEIYRIKSVITAPAPSVDDAGALAGDFRPLFDEDAFAHMVELVKSHIYEGDIFQAVVSNRFSAPFRGSLMNTYRTLRTINPSPYMVYMRAGDLEIACSSPETLVSLRGGEVSSYPLAGSCPRGATDEEDAAHFTALLADGKELAEHDMLVDLARNDVGRVCGLGSVEVREYRQIKSFSHISHIGSRVCGQLREPMDAMDVLAAALPAGTLSGAPKRRACEIIDACEGTRRGVYGGAIGYFDFAGNMDMCIGIRMAVLRDGEVHVQAGAGIVADSDPRCEYQETLNKARAVMAALERSGEM